MQPMGIVGLLALIPPSIANFHSVMESYINIRVARVLFRSVLSSFQMNKILSVRHRKN